MLQNKCYPQVARALIAGTICWLVPLAAASAADDYLSILEAEASDTGSRSEAAPEVADQKHRKITALGNSKAIESGLTFEAFEELLDSSYSGTHLLYVKLSGRNRKAVYRFYQEDNRISAVREEIVRLLSSG
jgi:hypothetical protein